MADHQHQWRPVIIATPNGMRSGKQCACGMQTIGGLNAGMVVAAQRFNRAMERAVADMVTGMADQQRRQGD